MISKYDYYDLRKKATGTDATQEDINRLGEWFSAFGVDFWNGEFYDADEGLRLFPIEEETRPDEWEITGYEFR